MIIREILRQSEYARTSLLSLVVVVSILLALLIIPSWQKNQSDRIAELLTSKNNIVNSLNDLEVSLQEMRAATRGFIITENEIFNAQFEQASARQQAALELFVQEYTVSRSVPEVKKVTDLAQQIDEWRSNRLRAQINMVERGERDEAERAFLLGVSQQSYEKIRTVISELRAIIKLERRLLTEEAANLRSQSTITNQILVVFALIGVGIIVIGFNRLTSLISALQHSEKAAQHLSEELANQLTQVNHQNNRLALAQQLAVKSSMYQSNASRIQHLLEILAHDLSLSMVVVQLSNEQAHTYYTYVDEQSYPLLMEYVQQPDRLTHVAVESQLLIHNLHLSYETLAIGNRVVGTLFVVASRNVEFDQLLQQQFTLLFENYYLFEQIEQEQSRIATVLDTVPIGLMLINTTGHILVSNQKSRELIPAANVGTKLNSVVSELSFFVSGGLSLAVDQLPIFQALAGGTFQAVEVLHEIRDQRIPVRHDVVPIQSDTIRNSFLVILEDMRKQYELERLKSDFVSMISHELRTPLAAIVGAISMLVNQHTYSRDQVHEVVQLINSQGRRLQKLIDDVLNVSRIDSDGVRLHRERIDPLLVVRRVVERPRSWASITRVYVKSELPEVNVDVLRIEQVLENILDNAVKYAPAGDIEVHVDYDPVQKTVRISVRDFGTPISEQDRHRVFERFYQAHNVSSSGVGLGLAICKYFIESHGGEIVMEAAPDNKGTVVSFTLPLTDQLEVIPVLKQSVSQRVLVVDDDLSLQRTIQTMLQELEYTVVIAGSVREAYERLDRMHFDLVIVDVMLPDQSGIDFVRDIRPWSSIPLMMVTARNSEKDVIAGLKAGVDDYMIKPFSYEELALRVRNLLRRQTERAHDDSSVRVGKVQLLLSSRQVKVDDDVLDLTPIEHRLFVVFVRNLGTVLTHERILQSVWGERYDQENQYLWVHISHLRRKLINAQ
ncbi:MAG: response regulator, partial [Chloroflexi bacterium]|nr:response regulator [Chloroflexota bacterium]